MQRRPSRRKIIPKISSLPRNQSEVADYLRMYQITLEKRRLEQELENLDLRRENIHQRLSILEEEMGEIINSTKLDENSQANTQTAATSRGDRVQRRRSQPTPKPQESQSDQFQSFLLEY